MRNRNAIATIRQLTGKRYEALELKLEDLDERQLQEFVRLLNDVREGENRRCRGQASRMGLPGIIR
jgi:hypothetical protein